MRNAHNPLSATVLVKLMFLLRHETPLREDRTFYDFVPYRFGPFSFALYWELGSLRQNGYITPQEEQLGLHRKALHLVAQKTGELPASVQRHIATVLDRYGELCQSTLIRAVYAKYPWYAINSELADSPLAASLRPPKAKPAVYTVGYEGKSVDAFFNELLKRGIEVVVDVRANPISRKYGFSRKHLSNIAGKLGLDYRHFPSLGIPSNSRANLNGYASYQRLLDRYESKSLPKLNGDIRELAQLMQEKPSVLLCVEKDVRCCHRSRLAEAVSRGSGLKVTHL